VNDEIKNHDFIYNHRCLCDCLHIKKFYKTMSHTPCQGHELKHFIFKIKVKDKLKLLAFKKQLEIYIYIYILQTKYK